MPLQLQPGMPVRIINVIDDVDPYIFQFQKSGEITRRDPENPRRWLVKLHSAIGEWPAREEGLDLDAPARRRGDWR